MKHISFVRLSIDLFFCIFVSSMICLVLSFSIMLMMNTPLIRLLCQLLCFSASFSLLIQKAWQTGASDINRVKNDISAEDEKKGYKAALLAVLPFIITAVTLLLCKLDVLSFDFLFIYRFTNPIFMPLSYSLLPASQFLSEIPLGNIIVTLFLPLILPLICGLSYTAGYRKLSLKSLIEK